VASSTTLLWPWDSDWCCRGFFVIVLFHPEPLGFQFSLSSFPDVMTFLGVVLVVPSEGHTDVLVVLVSLDIGIFLG
jgi:hypothetical protein